jgi:predicted DsbA family dithiol-disulfide isomerase
MAQTKQIMSNVVEMAHSVGLEFDFEEDIDTARQFQISGVPFFVFDRKYAISGAQEVEVFLGALLQRAG